MDNVIKNQDIIDFRNQLIKKTYAKIYCFGLICNDEKTNVMTPERKKVLEDILIMFNQYFTNKGYDID